MECKRCGNKEKSWFAYDPFHRNYYCRKCIAFGRINADEELKEAESTLKVLNCEIEKIDKFILPDQVSERAIIKIRKEKETPDTYPRKYDKIKKQVIK